MRVDLLLWWVKQPKNAATHAPLTYKQQHHAHQEHTTHLTRVATRQWPLLQDREVFDTLGATILVVSSGEWRVKKLARHKVSVCIDFVNIANIETLFI
jgi:hypothetical protein